MFVWEVLGDTGTHTDPDTHIQPLTHRGHPDTHIDTSAPPILLPASCPSWSWLAISGIGWRLSRKQWQR